MVRPPSPTIRTTIVSPGQHSARARGLGSAHLNTEVQQLIEKQRSLHVNGLRCESDRHVVVHEFRHFSIHGTSLHRFGELLQGVEIKVFGDPKINFGICEEERPPLHNLEIPLAEFGVLWLNLVFGCAVTLLLQKAPTIVCAWARNGGFPFENFILQPNDGSVDAFVFNKVDIAVEFP